MLEIEDLHIAIGGAGGERTVVESVSLEIRPGETVGVVGESGSGKSLTARAVLRILPRTATARGAIRFEGADVLAFDRRRLGEYRSHAVAMIYQNPRAVINPVRRVGEFLVEAIRATKGVRRPDALRRAVELLAEVRIADPERCVERFPHELSGGMLQRVAIAGALIGEPRLLLADEPTTALDASTQAEVVAILKEASARHGQGLMFITHNLDLAAAICERTVVMYAGATAEAQESSELYRRPRHPYTAALLACRPTMSRTKRMTAIPGQPAAAYEVGAGCPFAQRCAFSAERCSEERPPLRAVEGGLVACHRSEEIAAELRLTAAVGEPA